MTTLPPTRPQDEATIRALVAAFDERQFDVDGVLELLHPDAVVINLAGRRVVGREAFREAMARALASSLVRVRTRTEVLDLTFLRDDVALVGCRKRVHDGRDGHERDGDLPRDSVMQLVVVRGSDGWRIAAAQTTPVPA